MKARSILVLSLLIAAQARAQPVPQPGLTKVVHDTSMAGNGTNTSSLGIRRDCSDSQVLKWSSGGSAWACGTGAPSDTIEGTLTTGVIPVATGAHAVGNGHLVDSANFTSDSSGNMVFGGTGSFGGALNMNSFKITGLANGTVSTDVAAFGQIASGIASDFTGTTNTLPKRTGTTTYGDSSLSDDGTTVKLINTEPLFQLTETEPTNVPPWGNPVVSIGGGVPGSSTNMSLANYGTFEGIGDTFFKYPTGFGGQTQPLYAIDMLKDEHNMTAEDIQIRMGYSGGYDTTAGAITDRSILCEANANRNAGSNPLTNVCGFFDAVNGQTNYAIHAARGDNLFDGNNTFGTTGTPTLETTYGTQIIQQSATTAQASLSGTGLELATGGANNLLSFRNPDVVTNSGIVWNNVTNAGDGYITYKHSSGMTFGVANGNAAFLTTSTFTAPSITTGLNGKGVISNATGTPNTNVTGSPGDLFLNNSGGAGSTLWIKESGTATDTGWVAAETDSAIAGTTGQVSVFNGANSVTSYSGFTSDSSGNVGTASLTATAHVNSNAAAQSSGNLSSCGTGSPAIASTSNDTVGVITEGTGATGCTMAFTTSYTVAPVCECSGALTGLTGGALVYCSASPTAMTAVNAVATGDVISYHCFGARGSM